jgi:hypothetical protein
MPLTETQMKYLALAWQCFESEPKVSACHLPTSCWDKCSATSLVCLDMLHVTETSLPTTTPNNIPYPQPH